MDILDIDEALKDDSFIFLADKTHDDVSNILQQWKTNNTQNITTTTTTKATITPTTMTNQQNEQAYKLNSKTFTRPRRRSAQNLEKHFLHHQNYQQHTNTPTINLEIGGLVTNMQKSFLQDTSPPASICSSMEISIERMNNSLISSADFTNLNFLQSTQSLDFNNGDINDFNLTNKSTTDGYTLSDMIRDRKALESLTMSGDGTLIKDSNIAQFDDISLTLSKTASGCSTMDNSTDSAGIAECNNHTIELEMPNIIETAYDTDANTKAAAHAIIMQRTMVLSNDMIGETTFNLIENSMRGSNIIGGNANADSALDMTLDVAATAVTALANETFKKPAELDETVLINANNMNTTIDYQQQQDSTSDMRCETPENVDKKLAALRYCESTPQTASLHYQNNNNSNNNNSKNKLNYTPSIKMCDDVNISPIIATDSLNGISNATRIMLNNTYEPATKITTLTECINSNTSQKISTDSAAAANISDILPQLTETMEFLQHIENPNNETYNRTYNSNVIINEMLEQDEAEDARKQMQCVMDLAEAEVEMLTKQEDEEQFEHMLDELGKVEWNAQQVKMQKSLDSIKKRFNYSGSSNTNNMSCELSRESNDMRELTQHMNELMTEELTGAQINLTVPIDIKQSTKMSKDFTSSPKTLANGSTAAAISSERLLSRRSRLYDDVNLSLMNTNNDSYHRNSTSFTVQKADDLITEARLTAETDDNVQQETEINAVVCNGDANVETVKDEAAYYKLAEKRERDRDRFKTIKINKQRNTNNETELNVPCIDDDRCINVNELNPVGVRDKYLTTEESVNAVATVTQQQKQQRISRRDHNIPSPPVFNNNKSEVEQLNECVTNNSTNYLTYKKPKEKRNVLEIKANTDCEENIKTSLSSMATSALPAIRMESRSLSRPRYISGLQKFSSVCKATSAGDLQKTITTTTTNNSAGIGLGRAQLNYGAKTNAQENSTDDAVVEATKTGELKSPMGIKSKSFHNLSSNSGLATPRVNVGYGLKKLNTTTVEKTNKFTGLRATSSGGLQTERSDDAVFKMPKLMSSLRVPSSTTSGLKRAAAGLARPSSGYYSFNVATKLTVGTNENDATEGGRQSPTESLSSASSRGSLYGIGNGNSNSSGSGSTLKQMQNNKTIADNNITAKLAQVTTSNSGIPKPSGLRPPSNIKRSALPRPSSTVRR